MSPRFPTFARSRLGVALLSLAWLALLAWPRPLMLPDEGRYVGVAWEMMRTGDWLVPTLNGLPYFHKPPLFYWITAASMSVFGLGDWAARAAPLLGAWAGAMAIFLFVQRWWGRRAATLALVVLLTQPLFYIGGQFANLDMLVAGCITVTVLLLAHAALLMGQGTPYRKPLLGAYVAAALGVLAKGLIGFVLPALVIAAWLLACRRPRALLRLISAPGVALFLLIAAPWFIAMQLRFAGFLDYFFVVQHFKRFAAGGFNNVQPFWFYPAVLLLFTLPWLPWIRPQLERGRLADPVRGEVRTLMALWVVVIVAFFSMPASKLLGYVLPAVPPLAVLLADGVETWLARSPGAGRRWRASAGVSVAICLVVVGTFSIRAPKSSKDIGASLHQLRQDSEPVFMLDDYYFDLPLYARLRRPVASVVDWADPEIRRHDGWRKELADAGDFAPERAEGALMSPATLGSALCAQPVSWVVGPESATARYPVLAHAEVVRRSATATLWRVSRDAPAVNRLLNCPGTPSTGSTATS